MKKISYLVVSLIILINMSACTGYKPIFGSSNLEFKITDYSLSGNKKLGNQIYSQLYNLSKASKKSPEVKNIYISIHTSKNINAKNNAGITALIYAAMYNQEDMVKLLLKHKADKTIVDNEGKKAIDYAKEKGFNSIAETLE